MIHYRLSLVGVDNVVFNLDKKRSKTPRAGNRETLQTLQPFKVNQWDTSLQMGLESLEIVCTTILSPYFPMKSKAMHFRGTFW